MALLAVVASAAQAATDSRIKAVETAWRRGDVPGVQTGWTRDTDANALGAQARLATAAEHGGRLTVLASERVAPKIYAADVLLDDSREVWLWIECEKSHDWCYWGRRRVGLAGAAEIGQGLDAATSVVGVAAAHASELNPIGVAVLPLKVLLTSRTHTLGYTDCVGWRTSLDSVGTGAGLANIAVLAANITQPVFSLGLAFAAAYGRHDRAKEEALYECAAYALNML